MLLEPNRALDEPFRFSHSGLGLMPWTEDDGSVRIVNVYPKSPAGVVYMGVSAGARPSGNSCAPLEPHRAR